MYVLSLISPFSVLKGTKPSLLGAIPTKAHVEKACKGVEGTVDAVVDLAAKNVTVTGTASLEALKAAIVDAGYEVIE